MVSPVEIKNLFFKGDLAKTVSSKKTKVCRKTQRQKTNNKNYKLLWKNFLGDTTRQAKNVDI